MTSNQSQPTEPRKNLLGFFVFLPNTFDFPVKIDDNPNTRVTTMSKQTTKGRNDENDGSRRIPETMPQND